MTTDSTPTAALCICPHCRGLHTRTMPRYAAECQAAQEQLGDGRVAVRYHHPWDKDGRCKAAEAVQLRLEL